MSSFLDTATSEENLVIALAVVKEYKAAVGGDDDNVYAPQVGWGHIDRLEEELEYLIDGVRIDGDERAYEVRHRSG